MESTSFINAIIGFTVLIIAAVLHEISHAITAEKLGDPTARKLGRITLNPIKHIDPFLTIILPGLLILSQSPVIFGGAKPVPVNPAYFSNPRRGMAIVAAAGPISNVILAFIGYGFIFLMGAIGLFHSLPLNIVALTASFLIQWVLINFILAAFNLFPLPPLDGGRIMVGILPKNLAIKYAQIERFGLLLIFLLLYAGIIDSYLTPIINLISEGLYNAIRANL